MAGGLGGGGKIKIPHPKKRTASTILYASQKILANFELFLKGRACPLCVERKGRKRNVRESVVCVMYACGVLPLYRRCITCMIQVNYKLTRVALQPTFML